MKITTFSTMPNRFPTTLGYDYIWQLVLAIAILIGQQAMVEEVWEVWLLDGTKLILVVHTTNVYHKLIEDRA